MKRGQIKGQITVFIILGILIVIAVGFIIYLSSRPVSEEFEAKKTIAQVPQEVQPVYEFVQQCIYDTAKEGIKRLGEQGGYLYEKFNYDSFQPTESDAVSFTKSGSLIVPYWFHMSSPNSCSQGCSYVVNKPPLTGSNSIEFELSKYVSENLLSCTNFDSFKQQGYEIQVLDDPVIKATITDNNVFFSGSFPINVEKAGSITKFEDYYVPLDVNIKQAYNLASELLHLQQGGQFLEAGTIELINVFSGLDKDKLPPFYDLEVGNSNPEFWVEENVKNQLTQIISSYTSLTRASGTQNFNHIVSPPDSHRQLFEVLYNRQFFLPLNKTYPDYSFKMMYFPSWSIYFDLNCNGQLCTAGSASIPLDVLFSLQEYNFAYDVSYPVLFFLEDEGAFNGEGFVFQFFMESNIRNNEPLSWDLGDLQPLVDIENSIFCNPDQFNSGVVNITVLDKSSKMPVDASILFKCGKESCLLGRSENGKLSTRLPKCIGGVLSASAMDYLNTADLFDSDFNNDVSILMELQPKANVKVTARKHVMTKSGKHAPWRVTSALASGIDNGEQVVVVLSRKKETPFEDEFKTVIDLEGSDLKEVMLVPGEYNIRLNSIKRPSEDVVIPKDKRCKSFGFPVNIFKDDVCYDVPDSPIVFNEQNPIPYGGSDLNATLNFKEGDTIEFRYLVVGLDLIPERMRVIEDLSEFTNVDLYSKGMRSKMVPVVR